MCEVGLLACAAHYDRALVDTGDKRSLRALGSLSSAGADLSRLQSKVACLEQTIGHLIERWTFPVVKAAVGKHPHADASVDRCVTPGNEAAAGRPCRRLPRSYDRTAAASWRHPRSIGFPDGRRTSPGHDRIEGIGANPGTIVLQRRTQYSPRSSRMSRSGGSSRSARGGTGPTS